ncbi:hypothetical protein FRC08_018848 [Ceratobasidium sp. 394]|nr:hypothetical protein FRC08_018848 [Ceratobasidium sp. 394]KAG9094480.1 hypothetical protein FS749_012397 [Ceratobasidium sp. UAMH 11750]
MKTVVKKKAEGTPLPKVGAVKLEDSASSALKDSTLVAVKQEDGADPTLQLHRKNLVRTHALKSLTGLCGLKEAQDTVHLVPRFTEHGEPDWFNEDSTFIIPHFDRKLSNNLAGWDREYLMSVPLESFRAALTTGAFATLWDAWKKKQGGKWDERKEKKNRVGRCSGRKTTKAKNRGKALELLQLDAQKFWFLADPGFESSEESDPDDKKCCVVKVPAFRSSKAQKLVGALDVKYSAMKTRPRNPVFTQIDYRLVDVPVPALKKVKHQPVLGWVVRKKWAKKNPGLECSSRPYFDSHKTEMPQAKLVKLFVRDHEPNTRVYLNPSPDSDAKSDTPPAPAPVSIPVEPDTPTAPTPDAPAPDAPSTNAPAPDAPSTNAPAPNTPASAAPAPSAPSLTEEAAPVEESIPAPEAAETTTRTGSRKRKTTERGAELKERKKKKKESQAPWEPKSKEEEPKSKKERIKAASVDAGSHVQDPAPGMSKPVDTGNVKSVKLHIQGS